jgi:hypothetical protein
MTGYLAYLLQTDQRANVSTNTYGAEVTCRPTRSAIEQRLTRLASLHHCLLAADGRLVLPRTIFAIKNTKGIIFVVQ